MVFRNFSLEGMGIVSGKVQTDFWKGKRVFVTGHTGFKGSWLSLWLQHMGAYVKGFALEPPTFPSLYKEADVEKGMESEIGDIKNPQNILRSMTDFDPDILLHMAAQPLVRLSYKEPLDTFTTNVMGTANVLEAARSCNNLRAIVSVTTDKCYENKEWDWGYRENEPLGGKDPYSSSKACAELVTAAYRNSFFLESDSASIATARAGNVIGGGDWAADRLLPDILEAFDQGVPVIVRNPLAVRPWQHVLEPLAGYLVLAEALYTEGKEFAEAWNFGPDDRDCKNVKYILDTMVSLWGYGASWTLDQGANPHEANLLKLDCSKAKNRLHWEPKWDLESSLEKIINWHREWSRGGDMRKICFAEIERYLKE